MHAHGNYPHLECICGLLMIGLIAVASIGEDGILSIDLNRTD